METTRSPRRPAAANWWGYLLSGLLLLLLSLLVARHPAAAYAGLVPWFEAAMLVNGAAGVLFAATNREGFSA